MNYSLIPASDPDATAQALRGIKGGEKCFERLAAHELAANAEGNKLGRDVALSVQRDFETAQALAAALRGSGEGE